MSTLIIFLLLLLTLLFAIFNKEKLSKITLIFSITLFVLIGFGIIPSILLVNLQKPYVNKIKPNWEKKNAIVLLGAGAIKPYEADYINPTILSYGRITEAARLYYECLKSKNLCNIIISGGDALKVGSSEAEVYQKLLLSLNVSKNDIVLEKKSLNTYKNAEFTSKIIEKAEFNKVFLVTSGLHLKRSMLYFSNFGLNPVPVLSDYLKGIITILPNGYNFAMADFAIHEYLGIARFYVYNYLGLNKESKHAGAL